MQIGESTLSEVTGFRCACRYVFAIGCVVGRGVGLSSMQLYVLRV